MGTHDEFDELNEASDEELAERTRSAGPALPIASLVLCLAGALVGYYFIWLVGAIMLFASIVCGIIALRRHAPYRWMARIAIALSVIALIFAAAVISVIFYQAQQMNELLAAA